MQPEQEIQHIIKDHGGVLKRDKNHLVYTFPTGQVFTMGKTISDHRGYDNALHDLRKLLGISKEKKAEPVALAKLTVVKASPLQRLEQAEAELSQVNGQLVETQEKLRSAESRIRHLETIIINIHRKAVSDALPNLTEGTPQERLKALLAGQEAEEERHMQSASVCAIRITVLKGLMPMIDDPALDLILSSIMKAPVQVEIEKPAILQPVPPQSVSSRLAVTQDLVYVATQTFDKPFTVNDLVERMLNGKNPDQPEKVRIRSSIASMVSILHERGRINRIAQGIGKRQTIWEKVELPPPAGAVIAAAAGAGTKTNGVAH